MGGNADEEAGAATVAVKGLFGAIVDMGGNADADADEDAGAGAVAVNGLFGAIADIGGKTELDEALSFFAAALPKLKPDVAEA